jgi:hypothetical protein
MISEDLHFTHMWKTHTYLHHITKRGGCWPIKRVLPRHFSLKCLYQARGMSGHVLSIMTVSTIFQFGFDSVAFCVYYLIPNAGMRAWSQTHNHDRAFHWRVQYMFGILSQQSWKLLLCSKTKYKLLKCLVISLIWFVLPRFVVVVWGFVLYFSHFVYYDGFLYYSLVILFLYYSLVILFLFFIFRQFWYDILVIWLICFTFRQFSTLFSNVAYFFFQNQLRSLISRNVSLLRIFKPN